MTDAIQTDSPTAVAFLSRWRPEGPWVLTAIDPDRKSIETRTFHVRQAEDMRRWIERNNNVRNLYFHVNPTTRDLSKKAEREDIAALAWLHVDIDPRVSENIESERERALALLTSKLPAGVPAPTAIVFSGGGYQGFWKLGEPLAIDGDLARAEDAKRYNLQLELLFGADNCHNVDRIMRLPGTINLPDARKKRKGRQPALATLVSFDEKLVYPLSTFTPAPLVQGAESFSSPGKVNVSGNVSRLGSVDELPERVPDWCKVLIVQGTDPDNPTKYPSRSEALFTVCCELVRAGCDDQTIYTVITDPDFKISSSVIDKGSNAEKYAKRQIERAKEEAAANGGDPVAFVNRSYFAALEGGKVRYYREDRGRASLVMMNSEAFAFELAPHTAPVQSERATKNVPVSKLWATSTRRRYYRRGFVLDPTGGNTDDEYNLWRGFGIDAQAGDWSRMREHIAEVLAGGNSTYADYITRWAAWAVQNPATPPRVALVFRGDEGVGKGAFANALVQIFGEHGLRVQSMQHLTGKFNAHLRHCCMLFADEAVAPGDADAVGALKGLITEPTVPIEAKGVDVVNADNHLHVMMASNAAWVVPAGANARRFAMFDVPDGRRGDKEYFAALFRELGSGGLAAMLDDLLATDLTGWHPETHRPETEALVAQKVRSLQGIEREWYNILLTGAVPIYEVLASSPGFVRVATNDLAEYIQFRLRGERVTANDITELLGSKSSSGMGFQRVESQRPRGFILPSLEETRTRWNEQRFAVEWEPVVVEADGSTDDMVPRHGWHNVGVKTPF